MSDQPEQFDLKFLPDWLKEGEQKGNRYAEFEGASDQRERRGDREGRGPRGGRDQRDSRGPKTPRPGQGNRPAGPRSGAGPRPAGAPQRPGPRRDDRGPRPDDRGPRRDSRDSRDARGNRPYRPQDDVAPAKVKVEFLPEPAALQAIAKQIRSTHRAFPLFGTARLFLEKPERHRVRISPAAEEGATLFQLGGDGPIATDRSLLEREAFRHLREKYYREDVQHGEMPKGNFNNVARLKSSGLFLGPTNHHAYQPALRRVFEERFSRRMAFAEFQSREVEVLTDEQSINDWKEQARSVTTWTTLTESEPLTFKTLAEVEAHFRQHYMPMEIKTGSSLEANGLTARSAGDRALNAALREATERERGFPASLVNAMRPTLAEAGLHFFKHRKRIVFVGAIRPHRHPSDQPARDSVRAILSIIEAHPRCSRHDLALKILGPNLDAPEMMDQKTALAADLHYLLLAGHVIEFPDGKLDLPLPPKVAPDAAKSAPDETADPAASENTVAEDDTLSPPETDPAPADSEAGSAEPDPAPADVTPPAAVLEPAAAESDPPPSEPSVTPQDANFLPSEIDPALETEALPEPTADFVALSVADSRASLEN